MDAEHQKPVSEEFRRNWERIYRQQEDRKEKSHTYQNGCPVLEEERNDA